MANRLTCFVELPELLAVRDRATLIAAEWDRRILRLEISARVLAGEIKGALITNVVSVIDR